MNIVCIDECYNYQMEKYIINGIYCYYESDIVYGLELKYYNIYTREGKKVGTGNKSFIQKNLEIVNHCTHYSSTSDRNLRFYLGQI